LRLEVEMNFFEAMKYLRYGGFQLKRKGYIYVFQKGTLCRCPNDEAILPVKENGELDNESDLFQPCYMTKALFDSDDFEIVLLPWRCLK